MIRFWHFVMGVAAVILYTVVHRFREQSVLPNPPLEQFLFSPTAAASTSKSLYQLG